MNRFFILCAVSCVVVYGCSSSKGGDTNSLAAGAGGSGASAGNPEASGNAGDSGEAAGSGGEAGQSPLSTGGTDAAGGSAEAGAAGAEGGMAGADNVAPPCIGSIIDSYLIRGDGKLLEETLTGLSSSESTVLNGVTGMPLGPVASIQDGNSHGCAAVAGSAWCWRTQGGGNTLGQLGNGSVDSTSGGAVYHASQVLISAGTPLAGVTAVADGPSDTACAVTTDGKLSCWGNLSWATANGATLKSGYAVPITTDGATPLTHVVAAAVHFTYSCVIVSGASNNQVMCWGNNNSGNNLGTGDMLNHQYPTLVVGPTSPTSIAITDFNSLYGTTCVLDGHNVRCWGHGVLGNANSTGLNPALVTLQDNTTALTGITDLKRGFVALKSDGTIWSWGTMYASQYAAP